MPSDAVPLFTIPQESTQTGGGVTFNVFDPVTVQISIDSSNIQHQKLSLKLVTPKVGGEEWSLVVRSV